MNALANARCPHCGTIFAPSNPTVAQTAGATLHDYAGCANPTLLVAAAAPVGQYVMVPWDKPLVFYNPAANAAAGGAALYSTFEYRPFGDTASEPPSE